VDVHADDASERAGVALRQLVWDPVAAHLEGITDVIVAPADAIHMVPLDALPLEAGVVGDRRSIQVRLSLRELLVPRAEPVDDEGLLVALGGIDFDVSPAHDGRFASLGPATQRSAVWEQGFGPLVETAAEVRGIALLHERTFGDACGREVLEEDRASKAALLSLASSTRFLHIATHGYFAPESVRSTYDIKLADARSGLGGLLVSKSDRVRGMSPLVLCGLALTGANLPPDDLGRVEGVITAEEIAALDLSDCELGVLSACETSVGIQRASLGTASLQKALHAAGVRSVITSLWDVPDHATRELMVDFYRRLWRGNQSKHQALWEAKMRLREKRDAKGRPEYGLRDWSGWVLTGDPD
jgi:CHAT domain-containing protein